MTTNYEHTMRCIDEYLKYAPDSDAAEVHYTAALDWLTGSYEEDHTADEVRGMDVKAALDATPEFCREFEPGDWLTAPTPGMRLYPVTRERVATLVERVRLAKISEGR